MPHHKRSNTETKTKLLTDQISSVNLTFGMAGRTTNQRTMSLKMEFTEAEMQWHGQLSN